MSATQEIWCGGDFMPSHSFAAQSREVWDAFRRPDYVFVNLETPLTTSSAKTEKTVWLSAPPRLASELAVANIHGVTIANNHVMDFGSIGLNDTCMALDGSGIDRVGAGTDLTYALRPIIFKKERISVAFLGLSASMGIGAAATDSGPGVAPIHISTQYVVDRLVLPEEPGMAPFVQTSVSDSDLGRACKAVFSAKSEAEFVIVGLHWGVCHGFLPPVQGWMATYQQPLAHALIDAGADAIVGHGPHILHGIEIYNGKPIFYSLGHVLSHALSGAGVAMSSQEGPRYDTSCMEDAETKYGGMAMLTFTEERLASARMRFISLDEMGEPHWAQGATARAEFEVIEKRSRRFGTKLVRSGGGDIISIPLT
jgi:poly-gamma-glutamate capsule biosynthesis protein CapA/YwtB (metallophosphatase superfamily)